MDLRLKVTEPQADFLQLQCKYPLFVGGYGSGKSETLVNRALLDALESPEALVAIYAPTYDLIKLIIVPRLLGKLEQHGIEYQYNKSEHVVTCQHPQVGRFVLRSLDKPERIVGYESYRAHIDELDILTTANAEKAWNKIIARNRQRPRGIENPLNRVSAYCTPEGFKFLYQRWVKNKQEGYEMVTAASYSNPFLPEDYIPKLRDSYPGELVQAYIEGQFVNLTSGTVYNQFDRATHHTHETIREGETLFIGCDFNVTRQAATVYVQRQGGHEWHAVDELVNMYDTPEMIGLIKQRYPKSKIVIYPDASGSARKTTNANTSDIALLEQAGFEVRVKKSNPSIKDRVIAMNAALVKGRIKINLDRCPTVANCLEQQVYDANGQPDKKAGNDHQNDATTYPIAYEMPIRKPVAEIAVNFNIGY